MIKKLSGILRNKLAYVLSSYLSTTGGSFIKIGEATRETSRRGVNPIWNDPYTKRGSLVNGDVQINAYRRNCFHL